MSVMYRYAMGNTVTRAVYPGSLSAEVATPSSYRVTAVPRSNDRKFPLIHKVEGVEEEGCKLHQDCIGHMGVLNGVLILPQESCANQHGLESEQAKRAIAVSSGLCNRDEYQRWAEGTIRGKQGILRGEGTGFPVDGSIRMVIAPAPELAMDEIAVPAYVARRTIVPYIHSSGVVKTRHLQEGDMVICNRPPCLWIGGVQPMRVMLDSTRSCLGFPTLACEPYAADCDGDEVQLYVVNNRESIAECKTWKGTVSRGYSINKLLTEHEKEARMPMDRSVPQRPSVVEKMST